MLKAGVLLFCLTGLMFAEALVWADTRVLSPLDAAWPKGTDHWRTPEFRPNVSTGYEVDVWYKAPLPQATKDCLDHSWQANRLVDCGEPLSGVPKVAVMPVNGGAPLALLGNAEERHYYKGEYTHSLGYFNAQAGQSYQLDLYAKVPPETVAQLQPHIKISISSAWLETAMAWRTVFLIGSFVAFLVSIALIVGGWPRHVIAGGRR